MTLMALGLQAKIDTARSAPSTLLPTTLRARYDDGTFSTSAFGGFTIPTVAQPKNGAHVIAAHSSRGALSLLSCAWAVPLTPRRLAASRGQKSQAGRRARVPTLGHLRSRVAVVTEAMLYASEFMMRDSKQARSQNTP